MTSEVYKKIFTIFLLLTASIIFIRCEARAPLLVFIYSTFTGGDTAVVVAVAVAVVVSTGG